jgi:hypothetical protein
MLDGLNKWRSFEYWPYIIFYFPMLFVGLYLAIRARRLMYFAGANPAMKYGGVLGESKKKVLDGIDPAYLPKTLYWPAGSEAYFLQSAMCKAGVDFPVVAKPNVGERGRAVEKFLEPEALKRHLQHHDEDFLIQQYIDYPLELGVLYYRYPGQGSGHISSVVVKKFLSVLGDGHSTIGQLILQDTRARGRIDYLTKKFAKRLHEKLNKDEILVLEPIGNHCRGTTFCSGQALINAALVSVFDNIAAPIQGFYYGRFDIRVPSLHHLYSGRNIMVLELNGVSSEPAHIYDPDYSLFQAYRDVFLHMKTISNIARENRYFTADKASALAFLKEIARHLAATSQPVNPLKSRR